MNEIEKEKCLAGIAKCDSFLKDWAMNGKKHGQCNLFANKIPPEEVAAKFKQYNQQIVDGGGDESSEFHLVIFYANAKYGFIMRLVAIQEAEYAADESHLV